MQVRSATFRGWMDEPGWLRRFTEDGRCGAYLQVVHGGTISSGDEIAILHRPAHEVTVSAAFRAVMGANDLAPLIASADDDLPDELRAWAAGHGS